MCAINQKMVKTHSLQTFALLCSMDFRSAHLNCRIPANGLQGKELGEGEKSVCCTLQSETGKIAIMLVPIGQSPLFHVF